MEKPELKENELIKDIEGWEGLYAITSFGRVWNYRESKWYDFSQFSGNCVRFTAYKQAKLSLPALVLAYFGEFDNHSRLKISYKDGNHKNCAIDNLMPLCQKKVKCKETGKVYNSASKASMDMAGNVHYSIKIANCCRGASKKTKINDQYYSFEYI